MDEVLELGEAVDSEEGASEEQKEEFKSLEEKDKKLKTTDELGFKKSVLKIALNLKLWKRNKKIYPKL